MNSGKTTYPRTQNQNLSYRYFKVKTDRSDSNLDWNVLRGFGRVERCRAEFGRAVGGAIQYQAIGVVAQPIQGCRSEQPVGGKGLVPLGEVQVAGDHGGGALVALGDEVVQIFVRGWPKRFQAEVVNDDQRHACQGEEFALVATGGARGVQAGGEVRAGAEQDIHALAHGAVSEGLGKMGFAGAAGADDENGCALSKVAPGGQIVHQGAVRLGQALEVKRVEGLGGAKRCAAKLQGELLLFAPRDFVGNEHGQELGVGEFRIDRLAVAGFQGIENARQAPVGSDAQCVWGGTARGDLVLIQLGNPCLLDYGTPLINVSLDEGTQLIGTGGGDFNT